WGAWAMARRGTGGWRLGVGLLPWPGGMGWAIARARLRGTEKPWLVPFPPMFRLFAAVFIAITWPAAFASGPPESPSEIGALVWNMFVSRSDCPGPASLPVMLE